MPTILRAQVVLAHNNGLPRDAVTNTFHFDPGADGTAIAEAVAEDVEMFYNEVWAPAVVRLNSFFSRAIASSGHQVRMYPVDVETGDDPRGVGFPPLFIRQFSLTGRALPGTSEPGEVAVCLSYRNMDSSAVPPARRRGRIYFGPIHSVNTIVTDSSTGRASVNPNLTEALRAAGLFLASPAATGNWVIYSRPFAGRPETPRPGRTTLPALPARDGAVYPVTHVFTDDAFDTQRRRGERAITRTTQASA